MENAQSLSIERIMAAFGEWPYFSGGHFFSGGGSSRGPGIVNCNQAKLSKKELISPVPCSLGEDPEILMELSNFLHSTVNS